MGELIPDWLKPALRFGTGVGIVIGPTELTIYLVKVRPKGPSILGTLRIEGFRERPAAEWGGEYRKFLEAFHLAKSPALAVLPSAEVILRVVPMPGVTDEDAPSAIRFQLDGLHPYDEDSIAFDFRRVGATHHFAVAIARRETIEAYATLFAEAGVALSGVTTTASTCFSSLRIHGEPPASGVLAVRMTQSEDENQVCEIYAESPARPLFSAAFEQPLEHVLPRAVAELRLDPGAEARELIDCLPAWLSAPEQFDFSEAGKRRAALPYAAGLTAALPRFAPPLNLLPLELRSVSSRLMWVPTFVLGSLLAIALIGWAVMGAVMERRYLARLDAEVRQLTPRAAKVEALDRQLAETTERVQLLSEFKRRTRDDLDLMQEMTALLPPPAWLPSLLFDRTTVNVVGDIVSSDGLLKKFDASRLLSSSEFSQPLSRTATGELFRIRARREGAAR